MCLEFMAKQESYGYNPEHLDDISRRFHDEFSECDTVVDARGDSVFMNEDG